MNVPAPKYIGADGKGRQANLIFIQVRGTTCDAGDAFFGHPDDVRLLCTARDGNAERARNADAAPAIIKTYPKDGASSEKRVQVRRSAAFSELELER